MIRALLLSAVVGWVLLACDTAVPSASDVLVVEAFVQAEQPQVVLRRSTEPDAPYTPASTYLDDATVTLETEDGALSFVHQGEGVYRPASALRLRERLHFLLAAEWEGQRATAFGQVPPRIIIDRIAVDVPEAPVEAVFLDAFDLDSLDVTIDEGFIYPIEVTVWWEAPAEAVPADSSYWVQTRLAPVVPFSSTVLDFFLLSEGVFREATAWDASAQRYSWTGVYAIPVEQAATPLPEHVLEVGLVRSSEAYAAFARTRVDRDRREPLSNVAGGLGIVAGIALDTMRVQVPMGHAVGGE